MSPKKVAAGALALFALAAIAVVITKDARPTPPPQPQTDRSGKVVVTYFHGKVGCASCDRIETYTREAVQQGFTDELKKGTVEWREIDTDNKENEHYVADYQLLTRSVVVSSQKNGKERWKNLDRVWELLDQKGAFQTYIQDEVAGYLGAR